MTSKGNKRVVFFKAVSGKEPVRAWLKGLTKEERRAIGEDIDTLQRGWPVGMPLAKMLERLLWELRSQLPTKTIARIIFTEQKDCLVLLHGFIKKSQKTPKAELDLARKRLKALKENDDE